MTLNTAKCFAIISKALFIRIIAVKADMTGSIIGKMKDIKINGYVLDGALLVDDPDVKKTYVDASGQQRHVKSFSQPGKLKSYVSRHPEGIIIAGVGAFFFIEPIPVSCAGIRVDEAGNAEIQVRDHAESVEKQLSVMEAIRSAAEDELGHIR